MRPRFLAPILLLLAIGALTDAAPRRRRQSRPPRVQAAAATVDERPLPVKIEPAFPKLKFQRPVLLTNAGDGSGSIFVVSQLGPIHVFANDDAVDETKVFLDLSAKTVYKDSEFEKGILGLAFHPKFRQNGQFFVYYTISDEPLTNVVSRFRVRADDPDQADPASEEELMRFEKKHWNHNGGTILFGPDGYLYIATGDGGSANDPDGNGQNLQTLLGKILRLDVERPAKGQKYGIPPDNPFVRARGQARPEIFAYGLRNPWRMAFDRKTGLLWAAAVGQDQWEEIDLIVRGGNYGWNLREGRHSFGSGGSPPRADLIEPIWEYPHSVGKSITGGLVCRSKRVPELVGAYLYADFVSGKLWALWYDPKLKRVTANRPIPGNQMPVMSFGEDEQGEAYFTIDTGHVYRFTKERGHSTLLKQ